MINKVKTLVFCENFMSTETFTKCRCRRAVVPLHDLSLGNFLRVYFPIPHVCFQKSRKTGYKIYEFNKRHVRI